MELDSHHAAAAPVNVLNGPANPIGDIGCSMATVPSTFVPPGPH